ncbi:MAG: hypothetical protein IKR03_02250 [Clostridia bacterium]|nr:hypothetical protein [Christensenellaceae bacterium]MBR6239581.1 hypothetical protein [Clostridia bacterium]
MKQVLKEICVLFLKGICVLLICVLLYIITLVGCKLIGSDWDKKFAVGTYGCMNEENAYFIANDGIYDKKDSIRVISTDNKPSCVCVNENWLACAVADEVKGELVARRNIITYQFSSKKKKTYKAKYEGEIEIFLTNDDTLLVLNSGGLQAYDLREDKEIMRIPEVWNSLFQMKGFEYRLNIYQLDEYKIGILKNTGADGVTWAVITDQGNIAEETGRGSAILDITDDSAYIITVKDNNSYAVYEVDAAGQCKEIGTVPNVHDGDETLRYQFGKAERTKSGMHVLTMRKMKNWFKTETPKQRIYQGDDVFVFTPDWKTYQSIDLGNRKLVGSVNGTMYYLKGRTLYSSPADSLTDLNFEKVTTLRLGWKYIAFSRAGNYTVFE